MMREAEIKRKTKETDIEMSLQLDGCGASCVNTGCGFLDHMLTLFAKYARVNLSVKCCGDVEVDYHHTTEDVGIVLGDCIKKALGDMKGICRYGNTILPMDEALVLTALDISGRSYLSINLNMRARKVGDFDTELVEEFFLALVRRAGITLHVKQLDGKNSHHIIEATFKSFGLALRGAIAIDPAFRDDIPSTKGVL